MRRKTWGFIISILIIGIVMILGIRDEIMHPNGNEDLVYLISKNFAFR